MAISINLCTYGVVLTYIPMVDVKGLGDNNGALENIDINKERVAKALGTLKMNKAAGIDGLNSSFIKGCSSGIVKPLELIFRKSLETAEIPNDWKKQMFRLYLKKGLEKNLVIIGLLV